MQHDHTTKTETGSQSLDVISRTSGTNVDRYLFQLLYEIFEPKLVHSSKNRQPSRRNVPNSLMEDGGGSHIELRKCQYFRGRIPVTTATWLLAYM